MLCIFILNCIFLELSIFPALYFDCVSLCSFLFFSIFTQKHTCTQHEEGINDSKAALMCHLIYAELKPKSSSFLKLTVLFLPFL